MDDLFKIIFWIAIIISFLAPLFKKKETSQKPAPRRRYEDEEFPVSSQSPTSVDKEEYDIMQEIERMFKTDTSQPTKLEKKETQQKRTSSEHVSYETGRSESEYTSYEKSRSESEYTSYEQRQNMDTNRRDAETKVTSSEHIISPYIRKKEIPRVDASVERQAKEFEKFLKRREATNNMASIIRNRLMQPSTLKEYVIISEILKRPAPRRLGYRTPR